jgi:hypothetical protein
MPHHHLHCIVTTTADHCLLSEDHLHQTPQVTAKILCHTSLPLPSSRLPSTMKGFR